MLCHDCGNEQQCKVTVCWKENNTEIPVGRLHCRPSRPLLLWEVYQRYLQEKLTLKHYITICPENAWKRVSARAAQDLGPYGRNLRAPWRKRPQRFRSSLNDIGHLKWINMFPSALSDFWIHPKRFIQFEKKYWSYFRIVLKPTPWQLALLHHSRFLFAFAHRSLQVIGLYFVKVWKAGINANKHVLAGILFHQKGNE